MKYDGMFEFTLPQLLMILVKKKHYKTNNPHQVLFCSTVKNKLYFKSFGQTKHDQFLIDK